MVKIKEQLTEVEGTPFKVWSAPSSTEHGTKHYVVAIATVNDSEDYEVTFVCSCKGRQFNGHCWHVEEAQELLEIESE